MRDIHVDEVALIPYLILGLVGGLVTFIVKAEIVNRKCLRNGWPRSEYVAFGTSYCSKRIASTDSVIAVRDLPRP